MTTTRAERRRALLGGSVGNTVEWVDWALYTALAPVFAGQFFPSTDPVAGLLATLAVFAVGFVMRPVGGAVIGAYTDRFGRKKGLTLTILLMGGSALLLAICPPYEQIGVLAPIALVLIRLIQGFSAGGEFGSSSALLVESATSPMRRALAGSWQQVSAGLGLLLAALIALTLTSTLDAASMSAWGWRIAFAIGGLLGAVGLWLRVGMTETESFQRASAEGRIPRNPLTAMLRAHPAAALRVIGLALAGTLIYYIWVNYMPGFVSSVLKTMPLQQALLANTIALSCLLIMMPFAALLSDRIGRKPVMLDVRHRLRALRLPGVRAARDRRLLDMLAGRTGGHGAARLLRRQHRDGDGRAVPGRDPLHRHRVPVRDLRGRVRRHRPYITTWLASSGRANLVWVYIAGAALIGAVVYATMPETRDRTIS